jgi:non-canonical purine NTP pyrophosphatase (RdgB/HAM1 family)
MQRLPVESSDVVSIGYDATEKYLEIEFQGGRVYRYFEVPQNTYDHFLEANSYGGYFNAHINGYYRYRRIDEAGKPEKFDSIAIATGNEYKAKYFKNALAEFDIPTEQLDLPVEEIQGEDHEKIAVHKAKQAFKLAGRPVVVDDKFWNITALHGFPGAYMHDVTRWFKAEDFLALMTDKKDRSVSITDTLVYYDGKKTKVFNRVRWGVIVDAPRGDHGMTITQVVELESSGKTMSEQQGEGIPTFNPKENVWNDFAKWYNMQRKLGLV